MVLRTRMHRVQRLTCAWMLGLGLATCGLAWTAPALAQAPAATAAATATPQTKIAPDAKVVAETTAATRSAEARAAEAKAALEAKAARLEGDAHAAYVFTAVAFSVLLGGLLLLLYSLKRNVISLVTTDKTPDGQTRTETLGRMPLGLPAGTVRSALAILIVATGLWTYLLSGLLGDDHFKMPEALTGILGMVLGFYFGTRNGTGDEIQEAYKQVAQVQKAAVEEKAEMQKVVDVAEQKSLVAVSLAETASEAMASAEAPGLQATAEQQLALVKRLLDALGAAPPGLVPAATLAAAGAAAVQAEAALAAVSGAANGIDPAQAKALADSGAALAGSLSQGTSILGGLARATVPMLGGAGLAATSGPAAVAVVMIVGSRLGSAGFQRWRSRVLAAPVAAGLVEVGSVNTDDVRTALGKAGGFAAYASQAPDPAAFFAMLAEQALREGGADALWEAFGPQTDQPVFDDRDLMEAGLLAFQQAILAGASGHDVTAELAAEVSGYLQAAKAPEFKVAVVTTVDIETLIAAATQGALDEDRPEAARAAFDLLVMLVEAAREKGVNLGKAIAEIAP